MDDSVNAARPISNLESASTPPSTQVLRTPKDRLMLGFLVLTLSLASLVALFILIAYQNGPSP